MTRLRTLIIVGAAAALTAASLAMPATGADPKGTLALVNGIPGRTVDVCLNGKEIKSGLGYGNALLKGVVATGNKNLRFYARDARTCRGALLAKRSFPLAAGDDLTIVATKNAPKIVTFDNAGLGEIPPFGTQLGHGWYAWGSAADVAADFSYHWWNGPGSDAPVDPSGIFTKGQQDTGGITTDLVLQFRAAVGGDPALIVSPIIRVDASHRYEWILVGTTHANARFVFIDRLVSNPSP